MDDWEDLEEPKTGSKKGKNKPYLKRPIVDDTGTILLAEQHETYCQARAQGFGKTQSFRMADLHLDIAPGSIGPMAAELEGRPYIQERILQITEERAAVAKASGSKEEAVARWNDLYRHGQRMGNKDGLAIMVKAQLQLDKINGFDNPGAKNVMEDVGKTTFISDDWQEEAKRLASMVSGETTLKVVK